MSLQDCLKSLCVVLHLTNKRTQQYSV